MNEYYQSVTSDSTLSSVKAGVFAATAMIATAPGVTTLTDIGNIDMTNCNYPDKEYISMANNASSESTVISSLEPQDVLIAEGKHALEVISNFASFLAKNSSSLDPQGQAVLNEHFAELI